MLPTVYENGVPYCYVLRETGQDTSPKDNIIDPVFSLISKAPLTLLQKPSVYALTYNSLTRTIAIPTFKKVVNNTNPKDNNSGRVRYVGKTVLTRQLNGTFVMSPVVKLAGVFSKIVWQ